VACGLTAHQRRSALEPLSSGAFCCAPAPRRAELEVLLISQVRNKRGRKRKPQNRISHVTNSSKRGRISNVTNSSEAGHTLAIPSSEEVVASRPHLASPVRASTDRTDTSNGPLCSGDGRRRYSWAGQVTAVVLIVPR
jgi:hypothetical protein